MSRRRFEVRPVSAYSLARYPSAWAPVPPAEEPEAPARPGWPGLLLALVLMAGLALGVFGCFAEYRSQPCEHGPRTASGACPGPDPDCPPGTLVCDGQRLWTCTDEAVWSGQDCEALCQQRGGERAHSLGCDARAADPCQCDFDITVGVLAECTPGEFACLADRRAMVCDANGYTWTTWECDAYCRETHGRDYYSDGCDDTAAEACACEYGMIDGGMHACAPGEVFCGDEQTLMVCDAQNNTYLEVDCAEHCREAFGEDYLSSGCDTSDLDNPCGCEYGIVDGEPVDP